MTRIIIAGLLYTISIISGFWLKKMGKPFNPFVFNIHKFAALVCIVITIIIIYNLIKRSEIQVITISLIIIAILSVLIQFVSGALISIGKPESLQNTFILIHNITTVVTPITIGITICLLYK